MDVNSVIGAMNGWPVEDRLRLIEAAWDSVAESSEAAALTENQRLDLDRRLNDSRDDPLAGAPWPEVKARLQGRGQ